MPPTSELRWNPLRQEWVIVAPHRHGRSQHEACPFCLKGSVEERDDVTVTENAFPSLTQDAPGVTTERGYRRAPAFGKCEVVIFSDDHAKTLADLDEAHILRIIETWCERFVSLSKKMGVKYVLIFENKGAEVGVSLHHPHGQIYALPFVPPIIEKEVAADRAHRRRYARCLFCDIARREAKGSRVVARTSHFLAFVPFFARYPYEVHIYPRKHRETIADLTGEEKRGLAAMLKTVLSKYDALFGFSFPYLMLLHNKPSKSRGHFHFHIEFMPPLRSRDKIKYQGSVEQGAGTFINDSLPEEKARELRDSI